MQCPFCHGAIKARHRVGPAAFLCPACGFTSRIAPSEFVIATLAGVVIGGLLGYALGARDYALIASVFVGGFPGSLLIALISFQVVGARLVPAGGFVDEASARAFGEMRDGRAPGPRADSFSIGRLLTVGVAALAFVGLLSGVIAGCQWLESVYSVPAFAVHTGPPAFPVTVRIREHGVDFTNGSNGPWTCEAELGVKKVGTEITGIGVSPVFPLAAGQSFTVLYGTFLDGNLPLTHDVAYHAARHRVSVSCTDQARHTHFIWF